jgi:hypothetical protein
MATMASIVIESSDWSPTHRIQLTDVLRAVQEQVADFPRVEVILVLASRHAEAGSELRAEFPAVRVIDAPEDLDYYSHKNFGSQHAHGEFVLFLDSNCLPRDGWLKNALAAFRLGQPAPAAIQGRTAFDRGPLSRMWDVVWWAWSLREAGEVERLYTANNMGVRREVMLVTLFDTTWPHHTGQERHFGTVLRRAGHHILYVPSMGAVHNYAAGVRAFVHFSLVWGYYLWENRRKQINRADRLLRRAPWLAPVLLPPIVWARSTALLTRHWRGLGYAPGEIWKWPGLVSLLLLFSVLQALGVILAVSGRPPLPRPS